jgi:hypothetical protein
VCDLETSRIGAPYINDISHLRVNYLLTPWSRILFEKLTVSHLVKKFTAFYGTPRFITAFTNARHPSLSGASSIQSNKRIDRPCNSYIA